MALIEEMLHWWHEQDEFDEPFDYLKTLNSVEALGIDISFAVTYQHLFPRLANSSGHELLFVKAEYSVEDNKAAKEFLLKQKRIILEKDGANAKFAWLDSKHTLLGTITLKKKALITETNSHERFQKLDKILKKEPQIVFVNKAEEDIQDKLHDENTKKSSKLDEIEITPEIRAMLNKHMHKHYTEWLDEKLPALSGKTPREMAQTEIGRERVALLLAEMQSSLNQTPESDPMHGFSLEFVADSLGVKIPKNYWN